MKIDTLVRDIYALFDPKTDVKVNQEHLDIFSSRVASKVASKLAEYKSKPSLRMSNIGDPCKRKLWYSLKTPDDAEHMQPHTYIKFLFGDILEELLLLLARVSGHEVKDEQKQVEVRGVRGRIDAIIDGVLIDVKSASSRAFGKFERGLSPSEDSFGYLTQLGLYNHANSPGQRNVPAGFLAIDKQNGTIVLDMHGQLGNVDYDRLVEDTRAVVTGDALPPRAFSDVPEGKSGNRKLGVECSYCSFKHKCWPGLRAYYYARGPVYLTEVKREPRVPTESTTED